MSELKLNNEKNVDFFSFFNILVLFLLEIEMLESARISQRCLEMQKFRAMTWNPGRNVRGEILKHPVKDTLMQSHVHRIQRS